MAEILILVDQTRVDQRGPDQTMTEINARTVMFNLGPEDAIDSTTSAKIACYTKPLDASVHLNISADEHLPAGADYPWTTWKALNRLRTQVGRSRVNMSKWGYSNETETCDCGIRQTMQHLLVCPMMNTACSPQDLTTANDIAIGCARHWEGTI